MRRISQAAMGSAVRHGAFSGGSIGGRKSCSSPPPSFTPSFLALHSLSSVRHRVAVSAAAETGLIMEKITDKIAALPPDANYFSLEFFPPKTKMVGQASTTPRTGVTQSGIIYRSLTRCSRSI